MTSIYHYEVHKSLRAGNGQPERLVELRSDYYEKPDVAMTQLNATLTSIKGANGEYFTPMPVDRMERYLAEEGVFTNTVFLPDLTIRYLSITRISAR
ncbi:hypothetical protein IC235_17360 [Hymenobacter sp. BT664]|uniref:Uncharacterized protein n=1 Tax=Hymenobacter montanus TaxID=2771359 RepID=A0A927GL00_9BACT|nr:hypothetical protein [Hymenobacter montanus]MBD2769661.1 hypothetical protein [Hymenobacter montanus]